MAIRVYVLGLVFSSVKESSVVKLFTLIDQLDAAVRVQYQIERSCNKVIYKEKDKDEVDSESTEGDIREKKVNGEAFAIGNG